MSNRHWDEREGRKLDKALPAPSPGSPSGTVNRSNKEGPNPWVGAGGPKGSAYSSGSK